MKTLPSSLQMPPAGGQGRLLEAFVRLLLTAEISATKR